MKKVLCMIPCRISFCHTFVGFHCGIIIQHILYWRSKRKNKLKGKRFVKEITENFNAQFVGYSIISAIYVLLGADKIWGVEIFGSADAFLFITGFVVSVIINKSIPNLMPDDSVEKNCNFEVNPKV